MEKKEIMSPTASQQSLMKDLRQIIDQARGHVATTANYAMTMMYWHIGERINREVLGNQRAEYGKQIVAPVVRQLQEEYGSKGFEERNIRRMMQFAQMFPDLKILSPLVTKLSWSHFLIVMPIKDELKREFYLTMAASERWSFISAGWRSMKWNPVRRRQSDCCFAPRVATNRLSCFNSTKRVSKWLNI